ncbi:MAG: flotillin-like protein FloA [Planctomycetota bacterium]|nr:flotillin-like protein FloA [Planctomycetota bacterium]
MTAISAVTALALEWWIWTIIVVAAIVFLIILIPMLSFFSTWIRARLNNAPVTFWELMGMRLRKVDITQIVEARIKAMQAGISVTTNLIETHFLAGGDVTKVVAALISADRADLPLDFPRACCIDLAGRDVVDAVRTSVLTKVVECPGKGEKVAAVAKDGIQLLASARVTVRTNLDRLIGGATEETIIARVGQGIVTTIGSADSHEQILQNPAKISQVVLDKGLDIGTAFEILSIDISDVDIGNNIGAELQNDQAQADMRVAQAKAEERRALAVAVEQENNAKVAKNHAELIEAESKVPKALAESFRKGRVGV